MNPARDRYGLPLSTTTEAAEEYNRAIGRMLRVQGGAEAALRASVAADPGFALGHAGLALLGSEFGASVDVPAELAAAERAVRRRGTERERSHVAAVAAQVRRPATQGAKALLGHIRAHPRDALTVSVAIPTISSSGVTQAPEEAWALVEWLAPAYGDDWWFAGMLAFVRQEQSRWVEAAALADRALAIEPRSGHAVHARAHVYYETGDHRDGLSWLDAWVTGAGAGAHHRSHFSWHAALHELALGDDGAVRRRYDAQIAPPHAVGLRTLVDSGSLLWRCALEGAWTGPLPTEAILAAAGENALIRPAGPFAALHAGITLAAAGDLPQLTRLLRYAESLPSPVFRTVVAPVLAGVHAFAEGRFDAAATWLLPLEPSLVRLGGSAAQREIVEDTLLHALLAAGRLTEARAVLERRLDRRPSRRDLRRLGALPVASAGR